jgi:hypothetical protein
VALWLLAGVAGPVRVVAAQAPQTEEQRVLQVDQEWLAAEDRHDEATLRRILDERFVGTEDGETLGRDEYIREALKEPSTQSLVHNVVRLYGDTAIVVDTDTVHTRQGRRDHVEIYKCTITFLKRDNAWRAVAEQCDAVTTGK